MRPIKFDKHSHSEIRFQKGGLKVAFGSPLEKYLISSE